MSMQIKIAIIGVPSLEALGLTSILSVGSMFCVLTFNSPNELIDSGKGADICITTDSAFIANLSYFTLRKSKTIILSSTLQSDSGSPAIINTTLSLEELRTMLFSIINNYCKDSSNTEMLSGREIEVLKLIAKGRSYKEIADDLFISFNTVMTHKKNITSKLGIHSYSGLSLYAIMNGYGKPSDI